MLVPARDAAATLDLALRSVEAQDHAAWEAVVVDDGSRDDTAALVERRADRDPRVRLVRGGGEGLVAALNRGIDACRAPVVARLDADDWMRRDRLARQLAALRAAPGLSAVGCHVRVFPRPRSRPPSAHGAPDRRGRFAYERWLNGIDSPEAVAREAFVECPVAHPGLAIRRPVLERLRYRDLGWPEDYDLVLRLLAGGHRIGVVPRRLLGWRDHPGRLSRRSERYGLDRFTACKAAFLCEGLLAAHDRYVLWGYGGTGRRLARALAGHGRHPSHIVEVHPRRIGRHIGGAPVVAADRLSELPPIPVVASVAGAEARGRIRAALAQSGRREGADFVCAA